MGVTSELYTNLFQSIPVALCAVDRQGRILLINPALEQLLGWSLKEFSQQPLANCLQQAIIDPGQALCWTVALDEALAKGNATRLNLPAQFRTQGRDSRLKSLSGVLVPYQYEGMEPFGALAIFYTQELTESVEAVRDRFLGAISHETWSPISNISLAAELLAKSLDPDNVQQWKLLRIVQAEVTRLQRLVAQFLSAPDASRAKPAVPSQVVTLRPLIQQAVRTFTLAETRHYVTVHVPESLPFALGDAETIQEILAHLMDHALRHTRPGTEICLSAQAHPHDLLIRVAGVTSPLPVVTSPTRDKILPQQDEQDPGLTMARSLAEALGGQLWCEKLVDGGVRLCFTLRRAPEVPGE
jgi:signal transduction histidine kinase